jgi:hypothetical protein
MMPVQGVESPEQTRLPGTPTAPAPLPEAMPNHQGLSLQVQTPPRILLGQPLPCVIVVRSGEAALAGVQIELPLPRGCKVLHSEPASDRGEQGLRWKLGDLPAGAQRELRAELLPLAGADFFVQPQARFSVAVARRTEILLPPIGLHMESPESVTLGEAIVVRLRIRNNTPSTMRRVRLSCRLPEGLLHAQGQNLAAELTGDLAPGQERVEELALRAIGIKEQLLEIRLDADGGLSTTQRAAIEIKAPVVSLQVQAPRRVRAGEAFPVRLVVANPGSQPTPPLRVFLPLPGGMRFVSAGEKGQMHPAGGCIYWDLAPLPADNYHVVTASLAGQSAGDWALHGVVRGPSVEEVRFTQAVLVEEAPKLMLELSALDDTLVHNGETQYTLRVYNPGPQAAQQIQPYFDLPEELIPVQGEGPVRWRIVGQRVLFDPVARLEARRDATFQIRVRASKAGLGIVRAAVQANGIQGSQYRERSVQVK